MTESLYRRRRRMGLCGVCGCEIPAGTGAVCEKHRIAKNGYQRTTLDAKRLARSKHRVMREDGYTITKDPLELAYLAGVVDGEGCIYFSGSRHPKTGEMRSISLGVKVSMTTESVIRRIGIACPGTFFVKRLKGFQDQMVWMVTGWRAYVVLTALLPYLTGKVQQAALGVKVYDFIRAAPREGYRGTEHTKETREYITEVNAEMKRLKKNGGF